jgi:superfamily II DNA or RNA helicase
LVFQSVAYQMGIDEGIADGWLVPIRQEFVAVAGVDFSHISTRKNELGESDLNASELENVMIEEEALHGLAGPIIDRAGDRQTLVFTAGVAHAHMLADILNRADQNRPDHKPGRAAAVDGETLSATRADSVRAFAEGRIQYLCNFGVFTEGFDCPPCAVVAMGRPTKSIGLYTQMLGRGLRPLDGVVDGYDCVEDRQMAILRSDKPHMLVLDFVGNSQHKLISAFDVLGGNYDLPTKDIARREAQKKGGDVSEHLEKAKAVMLLLEEQRKRAGVTATVDYQTLQIDPFGDAPAPTAGTVDSRRGGSTDAQVALLVNLGVARETATGYTKRQAGAVIDSLGQTRCTRRQAEILRKYGEPTEGINMDQASEIIDEIKSNGWRPRNAS